MNEKGGKGDLLRGEVDFFTWSTGWEPEGSKLQSAGGAIGGIWDVVGIVLYGVTVLEEVPDEVVDYQEKVPPDRGRQHSED
jgi:hypothetical protein